MRSLLGLDRSIHLDCAGHYSTVQHFRRETMASGKPATLIFRIEAELKETVRIASVNEHSSITNLIAVMISHYCGRAEVEIAEPNYAPQKGQPPAKATRAGIKAQ